MWVEGASPEIAVKAVAVRRSQKGAREKVLLLSWDECILKLWGSPRGVVTFYGSAEHPETLY